MSKPSNPPHPHAAAQEWIRKGLDLLPPEMQTCEAKHERLAEAFDAIAYAHDFPIENVLEFLQLCAQQRTAPTEQNLATLIEMWKEAREALLIRLLHQIAEADAPAAPTGGTPVANAARELTLVWNAAINRIMETAAHAAHRIAQTYGIDIEALLDATDAPQNSTLKTSFERPNTKWKR